MTKFRLQIEYDGTDFRGFARSPGVRTVGGVLRSAIEQVTQSSEVVVEGASRTDTGVHALAQRILIEVETRLEPVEFGRALEALTPSDVGIVHCEFAPEGFHPRHDAVEKRYLYRIWNAPRAPVLGRRRILWVAAPLDFDAMVSAAHSLVGKHDFAAFQNRSKGEPESSVRTIRALELRRAGSEIWVQVIGDGFLYRMVRNIVGTLMEVGRSEFPVRKVEVILADRDRRRAGPTAPPHGLHLVEIVYPGEPPCTIDDLALRR